MRFKWMERRVIEEYLLSKSKKMVDLEVEDEEDGEDELPPCAWPKFREREREFSEFSSSSLLLLASRMSE
jgi:hypothetical protein